MIWQAPGLFQFFHNGVQRTLELLGFDPFTIDFFGSASTSRSSDVHEEVRTKKRLASGDASRGLWGSDPVSGVNGSECAG